MRPKVILFIPRTGFFITETLAVHSQQNNTMISMLTIIKPNRRNLLSPHRYQFMNERK